MLIFAINVEKKFFIFIKLIQYSNKINYKMLDFIEKCNTKLVLIYYQLKAIYEASLLFSLYVTSYQIINKINHLIIVS